MIDCLIIGFNDSNFENYIKSIKSMGINSVAYRDLNLGFIEYNNKPYRALDILTHFFPQNKKKSCKPFHNGDLLWPVVAYLGTYLKKRGFSFDYINIFHLEKDSLKNKLLQNNILTIAITTTVYTTVDPILEIISFVKKYNDNARIIIGGKYISEQFETINSESLQSLFRYIGADFYVISKEGESALVNILKAIKNRTNLDSIGNIYYKKNGRYMVTFMSREMNSLDRNIIDYSLFPKQEFRGVLNIRTAKSCPFSCSYCRFPLGDEKLSLMSISSIEKELNAIKEIGSVNTLNFIDATVNVPKERFVQLLKMMIKNKYRFKWNCFYRCDYGDKQTINLMKEAGCEGVFLGIESANDTMLERMNKSSRKRDYLRMIPLLKQSGISIFVSMIIGFPGETLKTAHESMNFIEETKPDFFRPQIWWCDHLTPIWDKRKVYGIEGYGFNWSHNTMDSKTACDLFESFFLEIENSIWVPEPGFNPYAMYYLKQRGMSMHEVKTFLKCFNKIVKEKIITRNKKDIDQIFFKELIASCQFDKKHYQNKSVEKQNVSNIIDTYKTQYFNF